MKTLPYIGISMRLSRHNVFQNTFTHGIPQGYVNAVAAVGAIPVLLPVLPPGPVLQEMLSLVDGVIISGSDSYISPSLWGEEADPQAMDLCPQSRMETEFDLSILRYSWRNGLPLLGICQGHELINIALGGTLKGSFVAGTGPAGPDDSPNGHNGHSCKGRVASIKHDYRACKRGLAAKAHKKNPEPTQNAVDFTADAHHQIEVLADSQLAEILQRGISSATSQPNAWREAAEKLRFQVNSFHSLSIGNLASCLQATALAADGTIEAIEWRRELRQRYPFMLGVQWHPELLLCCQTSVSMATYTPMQEIFTNLVAEAENFRCGQRCRSLCFEEENLRFLPHCHNIFSTI